MGETIMHGSGTWTDKFWSVYEDNTPGKEIKPTLILDMELFGGTGVV